MDCLFCKIANGSIPSKKVYEDDRVLVFEDIDPKAPTHLIAIPREHIPSAAAITPQNSFLTAHIFEVIGKLASRESLKNGFRVVTNCGDDGGQTVGHLHFHLLGGRAMHWPPG